MSIIKRKSDGRWQVNYRNYEGKLKCETFPKGKAGKKQAESRDAEIKYLKANEKSLPVPRREGIHLDELTQEWVNLKKSQGKNKQWLKDWIHIFNTYLSEPLCKKPVRLLTQADIIQVIGENWSGSKQATRNRYIGYLKQIFNHGLGQGYIDRNPLASWKKCKEQRKHSQLTLDDLNRIQLHAARKGSKSHHLAWALRLAWKVPVRPGRDLYGLTFNHNVAYDKGGIHVYHTKVMRRAFIRLPEEFMWELQARERQSKSGYLIEYQGKPVKRLDTSLANLAQHPKIGLGLPYRPTMYDVRHLWITTALDYRYEPSVIAHMAGTSIEMIHSNYYEPHAAEQEMIAKGMPDLGSEGSKEGKILKIGL